MTTVEEVKGVTRASARTHWRPRLHRRDGRAPLIFELAVVAWLFWIYDVVNNLAPTRRHLAFVDAASVLKLERSLHIDIEHALNSWLNLHSAIAFVATYYYFFAHVVVTLSVLVILWWRRPDLYRPLRTQLVIINLIAFAVFWRFPLAPPRMLPALGFRDLVADSHAVISWHSGALVHDADQYAAMPSLHIAWSSWSALAIWRMLRNRVVRTIAFAYPLVMAVVVIATGNHWFLDVLAGAATWLISLGLVLAFERLRHGFRSALPIAAIGDGAVARTGWRGLLSPRQSTAGVEQRYTNSGPT